MSLRSLFTLLAVLCLIGAAFVWFRSVRDQSLTERAGDVFHLYHAADPRAQDALRQLSNDVSGGRKTYVDGAIAFDLVRADEPSKTREAFARMKTQIAEAERIPNALDRAKTEATAINNLVDFAAAVGNDPAILREVLFNDNPYQKFLVEADGDIFRALVRLQEWSVELYPTAYAQIRLAGFYIALAGRDAATKALNLEKAKENLATGEALIERDAAFNTRERQVLLSIMRAGVYGSLALRNEVPIARADDLYKEALARATDAADRQAPNVYLASHLLTARYKYALFLSRLHDPARDTEIRELLLPYGDLGKADEARYLFVQSLARTIRDASNTPEVANAHKNIDTLAGISPEFKTFVERIRAQ
jgi:HAMP domain-containing protein